MSSSPAKLMGSGELHGDAPGPILAPELQGQFAEHLGHGIYGGLWVGPDSPIPNTGGFRDDVTAALRAIRVPVVRWPGGCFADDYHWRDGIGPRASRPVRVNTFWGGVEEPNAVGTHEFFDLASQLGAKTYLAGNVGTGSPQEMGQWLEYLVSPTRSTLAEERRLNGRETPFAVDFFAIGNEAWGCGGRMTAEHYANLYRQFSEYVRAPRGVRIAKVACGANADDYRWTEVLMAQAAHDMDALSLHYYTVPTGDWERKGSATSFDESMWMSTMVQGLRMEEILRGHAAVMDRFDPARRVGLFVDEWGTWHDVEPGTEPGFLHQQNTIRDAVVAAFTLNILHDHAERVRLAAIAQMVNVLQAMVLTEGDRMLLTPTYHVFDMYSVFQGATRLPITVDSPPYVRSEHAVRGVSASAARAVDGAVHVALVTLHPSAPTQLSLRLHGVPTHHVTGRMLSAPDMTSHNTFDAPATVRPVAYRAASIHDGALDVTLPPRSVVVLSLR